MKKAFGGAWKADFGLLKKSFAVFSVVGKSRKTAPKNSLDKIPKNKNVEKRYPFSGGEKPRMW